jgi:hypothetical protein
MFYVSRTYTASVAGSRVREAKCERCSCAYAYEMVRRAEGSGTSPYFLNNAGAEASAQGRAAKRLKKALERGVDPVPCPDCSWYQANMVREMRYRRGRSMVKLAIFGLVIAAIISFFAWICWLNRDWPWQPETWAWLAVWVGGFAGGAAVCLAARRIMLEGFDPNRDYPLRPAPYPGSPLPFKPGEAPAGVVVVPSGSGWTGLNQVTTPGPSWSAASDRAPRGPLGYERQRPEILPGGWVTLQLARSVLPPICCRCMAETDNAYDASYRQLVTVPVPLCVGCQRRERWRRWLWFALAAPIGWGAVAAWAHFAHDPEYGSKQFTTYVLGSIAGLLAGAAGMLIAGRWVGAPARLRNFQANYNTVEIKFRNEGYVNLYLDRTTAPRPQQVMVLPPRPKL